MHRPDSCNLFRGVRIYTENATESRKPMKSLLIAAALCLSLIPMSGITPASRAPVPRPGALAAPATGPMAPTPAASRKRVSGGQARWLRVVPGLFR